MLPNISSAILGSLFYVTGIISYALLIYIRIAKLITGNFEKMLNYSLGTLLSVRVSHLLSFFLIVRTLGGGGGNLANLPKSPTCNNF
jgi:hypothetical protein